MKRIFGGVICFAVLAFGGSYAYASNIEVPEPTTIYLLGAGLIGVGILARRKFKK
ncbi:MAG: PEP-CTERM sorting domain-containing protein [Candidatus Omnitrophica bacterium]|nr:PEP-CTERM sorting domain-containing protein [Candidatus Omnitrophota bacterium]